MTLLQQVKAHVDALSESEAKVARTILTNGEAAARFSITRLAQEAGTSVSAVQRLCRSLGYSGYKELRYVLRSEVEGRRAMPGEEIDPASASAGHLSRAVGALALLDRDRLERLVRAITRAPLVVCTGIHHSGLPAQMLRMGLEDLGVVAVSGCDVTGASHLSRIVSAGDCVVHFSVAGSAVPLDAGDGEAVRLPDETWLVTSGTRHTSGLPDGHVVALPTLAGGEPGDHVVMMAFVQLLIPLVCASLQASGS